MTLVATIQHFADALNRHRSLTEDEVEMLMLAIRARAAPRREMWTPEEDRTLLRMAGEGWTARRIGKAVGRSTLAVRSRTHKLRARGVMS